MSVTISNCEEIAHCPLNNSKAKMLYTFPKSERFKSVCKVLYEFLLYVAATSSTSRRKPGKLAQPGLATGANTTLPRGTH